MARFHIWDNECSGEDTEKASPSAPPAPIPKDPNLVEWNGPNDPENPQSFVGGAFVDFWGPVDRAMAVCLYAAATFVGPIFGPIIGGFLVESHLGWRWTDWITMIASFGIIAFFITPETYHPVLLQRRAARLRKEKNNPAYYSLLDNSAPTFRDILTKYLFRPFQMLAIEPILVCFTIYISLIYGILYLYFTAYPISFAGHRHWQSAGVAALPFLGVMVGVSLGGIFITIITKTYYARKLRSGMVRPEDRLPPMMPMAALFPAGLFWFGWTPNPSVPWPAQVVAGVLIGAGILVIWRQRLNYLIDYRGIRDLSRYTPKL
ncbi:citrinin biosynthesis cluster MFS transporter mrr1 [Penicillium ochrochloron]